MAASLDPISPWAFREGRWSRVLKLASSGVAAAPAAPTAEGPRTLTLITWNTWFGRTRFRERSAALLDELSWRAPEVIALQEATPELVELLVAHPIIRAHYQLSDIDGSSFDPHAGYGVLLLSKLPFVGAGLLHLPSRMGRRLLVGRLSNGLCVATVHLESTAECAAQRAAQLALIQPFLAAHAEDVVLMGDMNFAAAAPAETAALDPSFLDVWAQRKPADPGYSVDSLRNDLRRRTSGHAQERIDRVFVRGARWQADDISLTGTTPIDEAGTFVSDHFGLEAVLSRRSPSQP
jgi:endonuclease/exonuclease/phosphatase family metal-dependent hydrolase